VPYFTLPATINSLLKPAIAEKLVLVLKILFIVFGIASLIYFALQVADLNNTTAENIRNFEKQRAQLINQSTKDSTEHKAPKKDFSELAKNSVFGSIVPVSNLNPNSQSKAEETKLPLILIGVFMPEGDDPYAIIEDEKRKAQEVYMIGDSVFDVAKLITIYPDSVAIDRNGNRELLTLDNATNKGGPEGGSGSGAEDTIAVDAKELDEALQNLPLLLTQARAVPYFRDGKAVGLRLFAIRSGSLFEKIGMQNGDVLKTVNGNSLADMTQALQLFQRLKEERSVAVVLERNMVEKTIQYDIR